MYIMYVYVLLHYLLHQSPSLVTPTTPPDTHALALSLSTLNSPKALLAFCPLDQLKLHNRPEWEF